MARKGSGIKSVTDLRGKRVSLDEPGSGTLVDARLILAAYGFTEKDLKAEYLRAQQVADKLKEGTLDAFFNVSGWPQGAIAELAATVGIELVPIDGPQVEKLLKRVQFLRRRRDPRRCLQERRRREDGQRSRALGDVHRSCRTR